MSMEAVANFYGKLKADNALQEQAKQIKDQAGVIAFAREQGFEFGAQDMDAFVAQETKKAAPLSDEDLEKATGGIYDDNGYLLTTVCYGCPHWKADNGTWLATSGKCGSCYYWACESTANIFFWAGATSMCMNKANREW